MQRADLITPVGAKYKAVGGGLPGLIAALSAADRSATPSAIPGDLLLDASDLHAETLLHAEDKLHQLYADTAPRAKGRHLILSAPVPRERDARPDLALLLRYPSLLRAYLLAALRVSANGNVTLLLPCVETTDEIAIVRSMIEQAMRTLLERGQSFDELIRLGITVGTPSAVLHSRALIDEADFPVIDADRLACAISATEAAARPRPQKRAAVTDLIGTAVDNAHTLGRRAAVCGPRFLTGEALTAVADLGADALILPVERLGGALRRPRLPL